MVQRRRKVNRKIGLAPGTAVYTGSATDTPIEITEIRYDEGSVEQISHPPDPSVLPSAIPDKVVWVDVVGIHDADLISAIGARYGLHPLAVEDILNVVQRPKAELIDGKLFVSLRMVTPAADLSAVFPEHVSLVLMDGMVISFQERQGDVFGLVRTRIHESRGRIRGVGADYLFYALVDAVVDAYFVGLDVVNEHAEELEQEIFEGSLQGVQERLRELRADAVVLRRAIRPMREVLEFLIREEHELIRPDTRPYIHDALDHIKQLTDSGEILRDALIQLGETHRAELGAQANEVMKALTIVATIFIPLTFVAGIYGMNFGWMPELAWRWGYPTVIAIMLVMAAWMLRHFGKKGWL